MATITIEIPDEILPVILEQAENYGHDVPDGDPVSFLENHMKQDLTNANALSAYLDYILEY